MILERDCNRCLKMFTQELDTSKWTSDDWSNFQRHLWMYQLCPECHNEVLDANFE
jgi:hypothetical protein